MKELLNIKLEVINPILVPFTAVSFNPFGFFFCPCAGKGMRVSLSGRRGGGGVGWQQQELNHA